MSSVQYTQEALKLLTNMKMKSLINNHEYYYVSPEVLKEVFKHFSGKYSLIEIFNMIYIVIERKGVERNFNRLMRVVLELYKGTIYYDIAFLAYNTIYAPTEYVLDVMLGKTKPSVITFFLNIAFESYKKYLENRKEDYLSNTYPKRNTEYEMCLECFEIKSFLKTYESDKIYRMNDLLKNPRSIFVSKEVCDSDSRGFENQSRLYKELERIAGE